MPTVRSRVFPWQHRNPNPSPHSVGSWLRLGARAPAPSPPRPMGSPACLPFYLLYKMGLGGIQLVATWPGVDAQIATRGLFFLNFSPSVSMNVGFGGRAVVPDDAIVSFGDGRSVGEFSPRDKTKTCPRSRGKSWGQQKLKGEQARKGPGRKRKCVRTARPGGGGGGQGRGPL